MHGALKSKVTNAPPFRQTEMPLKVVKSVQIQCHSAAMRRLDCSKFSDPQPKDSCRQVECLFSDQCQRWRERSEAGDLVKKRLLIRQINDTLL